eukprot:3727494-Alexandrium_andersonii.AAC.1
MPRGRPEPLCPLRRVPPDPPAEPHAHRSKTALPEAPTRPGDASRPASSSAQPAAADASDAPQWVVCVDGE